MNSESGPRMLPATWSFLDENARWMVGVASEADSGGCEGHCDSGAGPDERLGVGGSGRIDAE